MNTAEDIETGRFRSLMDMLNQIVDENAALVGEVRGLRSDVADLRKYVEELETRAQAMASPENMQKAMQEMMGNMLG